MIQMSLAKVSNGYVLSIVEEREDGLQREDFVFPERKSLRSKSISIIDRWLMRNGINGQEERNNSAEG